MGKRRLCEGLGSSRVTAIPGAGCEVYFQRDRMPNVSDCPAPVAPATPSGLASWTKFKGISSERGDRRSQGARADSGYSETAKTGRPLSRLRTIVVEKGEAATHDFLPFRCWWNSGKSVLQSIATKGVRTLQHRPHLASGSGRTVTARKGNTTLKAAEMGLTLRGTRSESLVPLYVGGATVTVQGDAIDRYFGRATTRYLP